MLCPIGGDCTGTTLSSILASVPGPANSVVQQSNIVAQLGFWASNTSDGLSFFKCTSPVSCIQVGGLSECEWRSARLPKQAPAPPPVHSACATLPCSFAVDVLCGAVWRLPMCNDRVRMAPGLDVLGATQACCVECAPLGT